MTHIRFYVWQLRVLMLATVITLASMIFWPGRITIVSFLAVLASGLWTVMHPPGHPSRQSRDVIYGFRALSAREEMLAIRRNCRTIMTAMENCRFTDPKQYDALSIDFESELAKFKELEQRYFDS
jgi:hypothetical protein